MLIRLLSLALVATTLTACQPMQDKLFELNCARTLAPTTVDVTVEPVKTSADDRYSVPELTRMFTPVRGAQTLGMTQAELRKAVSVDYVGKTQFNAQRICLRPHVKVNLSFNPMTVYVARDFPRGSCKHQQVLEHEERHVKVYSDFLLKLPEEIRGHIAQALGDEIFYVENAGEAQAKLDALIGASLMPYIDAKVSEVYAQQKSIDTLEEYLRLGQECSR